TLDPAAPCAGADEQRAARFDPELEALIPPTIEGVAPSTLDSGRYCSAKTLGTLAAAGFHEVRFAGATWPGADASGLAVVVYRAPGLTLDAMADTFAKGADDARSVNQVHAQAIQVAGRPAVRIDAAKGEDPQTVYLWPATSADTINVIIGSAIEQAQLDAALAAMGDR
ncbi:MAG TPA: hypothetical protein VMT36_02815, partial [Candidatus Saccharimonadia bacterium]|nr:hypothetical protein [Candidatus Saccharimonadia bacterium]